ncbi:hypothetical protein IW261DRAFT_844626 [Armillaria novae-zelandiae]|uniref:Uncharacterized protein n=1 Tax=Armillaria novae-zelandiae TaxID=153914 RepID=A0AA39PHX4_9AGAR|nr:hypothetical protein IW261DRAFT_844626 [Armillaria novae-zelandiae]
MSNADNPSVVFFEGEPKGEIHSMTLSACISALVAACETDRVNIIQLEYIKYTKGWHHEAILVELQEVDADAATPRKAYALIDRDADCPTAKKTYFSSSPSLSSQARHDVRLSRDKDAFTTSSDRYEVQRHIDSITYSWPFIQLLVAASVVAKAKPRYNPFTAHCYWYAGSIWDVAVLHLQKVWSNGWEMAVHGSRAVPARGFAREAFAKFEGAWMELETDIKKWRQDKREKDSRVAFRDGVLAGSKVGAQEKEDLKRQNAALEARLRLLEARQG